MQQLTFLRILARLALSLLSLLVTLVVVELVLSASSLWTTHYYVWEPNLHRILRPSRGTLPGVQGDSRIIINSEGIRGDELAEDPTYRILAIGGSATECLYLDQSETWTNLLQQKMNQAQARHKVWVGNIGKSGLTTRDNLTQLKYLLNGDLPIDAIVALIDVNDFLLRLKQDQQYDPDFLNRPGSQQELLFRAFSRFPRRYDGTMVPFYQKTALWHVIKILRRSLAKEVQDKTGKWYLEDRQRRRMARIRNKLPSLTSALEEYSQNVNHMIELARNRSVRIIFLTQPSLWTPRLPKSLSDLLWMGMYRDEGQEYYSVEALATGLKRYNETLWTICKAQKVECIDLVSRLSKDTSVFYDDVHFNEGGAGKVAEVLAHYLLRHQPFKN